MAHDGDEQYFYLTLRLAALLACLLTRRKIGRQRSAGAWSCPLNAV